MCYDFKKMNVGMLFATASHNGCWGELSGLLGIAAQYPQGAKNHETEKEETDNSKPRKSRDN